VFFVTDCDRFTAGLAVFNPPNLPCYCSFLCRGARVPFRCRFSFSLLAVQLLAKDIVDPALRAFAVTNLDKDPTTGGWAWRINIDVILRSMGTLAQFESGRQHREEVQGRLLGGDDGEDELGSYGGDVSARV